MELLASTEEFALKIQAFLKSIMVGDQKLPLACRPYAGNAMNAAMMGIMMQVGPQGGVFSTHDAATSALFNHIVQSTLSIMPIDWASVLDLLADIEHSEMTHLMKPDSAVQFLHSNGFTPRNLFVLRMELLVHCTLSLGGQHVLSA